MPREDEHDVSGIRCISRTVLRTMSSGCYHSWNSGVRIDTTYIAHTLILALRNSVAESSTMSRGLEGALRVGVSLPVRKGTCLIRDMVELEHTTSPQWVNEKGTSCQNVSANIAHRSSLRGPRSPAKTTSIWDSERGSKTLVSEGRISTRTNLDGRNWFRISDEQAVAPS